MQWCLQNRDTGIEIHPLSHLQVPVSQLVPLTLTCLLTLSIFPKHIPDPLGSLTPWISAWSSPSLLFLLKSNLIRLCFVEVAPQRKGRTGPLAACACSTISSHLRQPLTQADLTAISTCLAPAWIPTRERSSSSLSVQKGTRGCTDGLFLTGD